MIGSLLRIGLLFGASTAIGLGYSVGYHGKPLVADVTAHRAHEEWKQSVSVDAAGLKAHFESGLLVIDARPAADFAVERLAAPMIVNIPPGDVAKNLDLLTNSIFVGQPLVIYCSSLTCEAGEDVWRELDQLGLFPDKRIYLPGWKGIQEHGLPTARGAPLDLRALLVPPDAPPGETPAEAPPAPAVEAP